MARQINKLSNASLAKLGEGMHGDGLGLWLQVRATGRSWIMRFTLGGRARAMGLGPLHTIGLADARDRARRARALILDGVDPIEARRVTRLAAKRQAARAQTFKACAEAYLAQHRAAWRNPKHAAQWSSTLQRYVYPVFGDATVDAVDVELVLKAVEPIWNTKPETAGRVRGRIETILDWATARGYRQGENPARWRGHLENLLPKKSKVRRVEHHAALPYADIGGFMVDLRQQQGVGARALEFAILTAARTGEVLGARWSEVDLAG
ncbi:MAG TPA: integrase arm-type DNA-binding domain-containing protein, partial [Stellaceae bacterium]|nr:integrase arm-type DNA-binding domain-containing protein [Stellaceae bacterium]